MRILLLVKHKRDDQLYLLNQKYSRVFIALPEYNKRSMIITIKYMGVGAERGEIGSGYLVEGLCGYLSIVEGIMHPYRKKGKVTFKVICITKNCIDIDMSLDFVRNYPELGTVGRAISSSTPLYISAYIAYAKLYNSSKKIPAELTATDIRANTTIMKEEDVEFFSSLLSDKTRRHMLESGCSRLCKPLDDHTIEGVFIGTKRKHSRIGYADRSIFIRDNDRSELHKTIEMKGTISELDKKTNQGTFTAKDKTYPFRLTMDNPSQYYALFSEEWVIVRGVATLDTEKDNTINLLEVEEIHAESAAL